MWMLFTYCVLGNLCTHVRDCNFYILHPFRKFFILQTNEGVKYVGDKVVSNAKKISNSVIYIIFMLWGL